MNCSEINYVTVYTEGKKTKKNKNKNKNKNNIYKYLQTLTFWNSMKLYDSSNFSCVLVYILGVYYIIGTTFLEQF